MAPFAATSSSGLRLEIADTIWLLHEYGLRQAFYEPEFYEQVVGGVSAFSLGVASGGLAAIATSEFGPWVAGGAGFVASFAGGAVGYFGGHSGTRIILGIIAPEMLRQREREQVEAVRARIDATISGLRVWPPAG